MTSVTWSMISLGKVIPRVAAISHGLKGPMCANAGLGHELAGARSGPVARDRCGAPRYRAARRYGKVMVTRPSPVRTPVLKVVPAGPNPLPPPPPPLGSLGAPPPPPPP